MCSAVLRRAFACGVCMSLVQTWHTFCLWGCLLLLLLLLLPPVGVLLLLLPVGVLLLLLPVGVLLLLLLLLLLPVGVLLLLLPMGVSAGLGDLLAETNTLLHNAVRCGLCLPSDKVDRGGGGGGGGVGGGGGKEGEGEQPAVLWGCPHTCYYADCVVLCCAVRCGAVRCGVLAGNEFDEGEEPAVLTLPPS